MKCFSDSSPMSRFSVWCGRRPGPTGDRGISVCSRGFDLRLVHLPGHVADDQAGDMERVEQLVDATRDTQTLARVQMPRRLYPDVPVARIDRVRRTTRHAPLPD